nr:EOG090X08PQ [Macrothrix elegans]
MPKTKKFIDKKNAVTFKLVHRSQKDPLAADERAPQRVLVPIDSRPSKETSTSEPTLKDPVKRKEEQAKFGVFFDDDYDYLQHLRDVDQTVSWELVEDSNNARVWKAPVTKGLSNEPKLKLPSSVFPSQVEEKVGLLNRAAPHSGPRPDLDPDVIAALDDDFDYEDPENELEDDFMALANATPPDGEEESEGDSEDYEDLEDEEEGDEEGEEEEDDDSLGDMAELDYGPGFDDDKKSRFTEYSMTSSVIRRNKNLTLLDDRFEQLMAQYDDEEMGALDCEEIEGYIPPEDPRVLKLAEEFEEEKRFGLKLNQEIGKVARAEVEDAVEKYLDRCMDQSDDSEGSISEEEKPERKWDCESILSTYSNLYNHPKVISEPKSSKIRVCPKTGIPLDVLGKPGLTKKYLDQLDEQTNPSKRDDNMETQSVISTLSTISIRPKNETPEQRKERKQLVKEYRKERRMEKKANTLAFKEEKKMQEKQMLNNRANVNGIKLL